MSKKFAFLFPGQGAQYPGMGRDFFDTFSVAKEVFQEADELLGEKLSRIIFEGPNELLTETKNSQLGIFIVSVALFRTLKHQMPEFHPSICSGLSLGEYTALYASNRLSFRETLLLVKERGMFMNEACEMVPGSMAAVLGLEGLQVEEAVNGIEGIWVANYNSPGQIVISGTKQGIEKATVALKNKGAKRVLPLVVHGAFHSGLMKMAEKSLTPYIEKASISESDIEFVMNVPGNFVDNVQEIKENLIRQVTNSVKWHQGISTIDSRGIDTYLEIGCGKTLSGMNRKIGVNGSTLSLEKVSDLDEIAKKLELTAKV